MEGSVAPIPGVFLVLGVLLGVLSFVVPVLGLYLLWRIHARLTSIEKTVITLVRDRQ